MRHRTYEFRIWPLAGHNGNMALWSLEMVLRTTWDWTNFLSTESKMMHRCCHQKVFLHIIPDRILNTPWTQGAGCMQFECFSVRKNEFHLNKFIQIMAKGNVSLVESEWKSSSMMNKQCKSNEENRREKCVQKLNTHILCSVAHLKFMLCCCALFCNKSYYFLFFFFNFLFFLQFSFSLSVIFILEIKIVGNYSVQNANTKLNIKKTP